MPTFEKSWQYDLNKTLTTSEGVLLQIKNSLISFAQNPWTVVGSGNGTTFGMDGVDRWLTESDVTNSSTVARWIVLKQSGILNNFQIMISSKTSPGATLSVVVYISPNAGFTGGNNTAFPTATDQIITRDGTASYNGYLGVSTAGSSVYKLNVWLSADGQCTRIVMYTNSNTVLNCWLTMHWFFERVKNPTTGWVTPYVVGTVGVFTPTGAFNSSNTTSMYGYQIYNGKLLSNHGSLTMVMYLGYEGAFYPGSGTTNFPLTYVFAAENKIDGIPAMYPVGISCNTIGARGRHGQFYDMYWATFKAYAEGSTVTNEYGRTFCRVGIWLMPWPSAGTVLVKG